MPTVRLKIYKCLQAGDERKARCAKTFVNSYRVRLIPPLYRVFVRTVDKVHGNIAPKRNGDGA